MNSAWNKIFTVGVAVGVTLSVSVLWIIGWKLEKKSTDTNISFSTNFNYKRVTEEHVAQGSNPPNGNISNSPGAPPVTSNGTTGGQPVKDATTPYVGGNYVSKSTIRYVIDDDHGQIEMYGYDVMRGRRVRVGAGKMEGRKLVIPIFHSFLDDTYGTLKLELSQDNKTFEGYFEGNNPAQEVRVVLVRLP
jgi:hypothetical protein